MPRRLLFALLVLVAAPLVLLGWLSASAYQQQQQQARDQLTRFLESRLVEIDRSLADIFAGYQRALQSAFDEQAVTIAALRQLDRENPIVRSTLLVNNRGLLIHPPKPSPEDSEKVALFAAFPAIISSRPVSASGKAQGDDSQSNVQPPASSSAALKQSYPGTRSASVTATLVGEGSWQVWYMDEGVQLIFWMPRSDGGAVGVLLERARWMADLTASLPDNVSVATLKSRSDSTSASGFTALVDEANRVVYRWGDEGSRGQPPLAAIPLTSPLSSWKLEYHSPHLLVDSASFGLIVSLIGIGVVLLSLGAYVLTGVQRQMRSAEQRVSFASQVSHELRTPLTNIRLYAELAETDLQKLPDDDQRRSIEKRLRVIDTESRRLGRLVSGVLELIREPRKTKTLRFVQAVPDELVDQALLQFAPSFEICGLAVDRVADASRLVELDADLLELILVNLLSNVEKYAGGGDRIRVHSRMLGDDLVVDVADDGPGIPWHQRRKIFRSFARLDHSIHAPSGTGIGLTIARRLARRHGGDLELVENDKTTGACFRLRIHTQSLSGDQRADSKEN